MCSIWLLFKPGEEEEEEDEEERERSHAFPSYSMWWQWKESTYSCSQWLVTTSVYSYTHTDTHRHTAASRKQLQSEKTSTCAIQDSWILSLSVCVQLIFSWSLCSPSVALHLAVTEYGGREVEGEEGDRTLIPSWHS